MRRAAGAMGAVLLGGAVAVLLASCRPRAGRSRAAPKPTDAAKANRRCTECHVDFEDEPLTVTHQKAGVACVRCHGHSQPHIDDEVRATKADATFRGKAMGVFCLTCHDPPRHRKGPAHVVNARIEPNKRKSCTQCHGEHKLLAVQ